MTKKILFVFHDSNPLSGATTSMLEIVAQLNKSELYEITALIPDAKGGIHSRLSQLDINYLEEKIYNVRYIKKPKNNYINEFKSFIKVALNYLLAIKLKLKEAKFDLIYTNTSDTYVGAYLARKLNIPHIWHIREFGLEDQSREHFLGEKSFYRLVSTSSKVIVISNALKAKLISFKVPQDKIVMIYNDVANSIGCFNKNFNVNEPLSLLIVGTITKEKGHSFLFECIKYMNKKGFKVKLSIVGDDSTLYAKKLKSKIKDEGFSDSIRFLGYSSDVNRIRKDYDVAVIASKAEAFGRVTIEAMHAKMTVIASDCGANPELIKHSDNGFLFEEGNVEQFSEIVAHINANRDILHEVGSRAHKFAEQFSRKRAATEVDKILLESLDL